MKNIQKNKFILRDLRKKRTRKKILNHKAWPRLSVFRSLKHIYAQIIDDTKGVTLCAASDKDVKDAKKMKPMAVAAAVGKVIAEKAKEKKISQVVFDRGSYQYHGRVKAVAEAGREGGLKI